MLMSNQRTNSFFGIMFIVSILIACNITICVAQNVNGPHSNVVQLPEAGLSVSLPAAWDSNPQIHQRPGQTMYQFRRSPITDSAGRNIIPNFMMMIESVADDQGLIEYSILKRRNLPIKVLQVIAPENKEFGDVDGIGYLARYDDSPGLTHKVYVVHAIIKGKGIEVIIDGTESVFDNLDLEYRLILKSFKLM
jgi:hypothetical protein